MQFGIYNFYLSIVSYINDTIVKIYVLTHVISSKDRFYLKFEKILQIIET